METRCIPFLVTKDRQALAIGQKGTKLLSEASEHAIPASGTDGLFWVPQAPMVMTPLVLEPYRTSCLGGDLIIKAAESDKPGEGLGAIEVEFYLTETAVRTHQFEDTVRRGRQLLIRHFKHAVRIQVREDGALSFQEVALESGFVV